MPAVLTRGHLVRRDLLVAIPLLLSLRAAVDAYPIVSLYARHGPSRGPTEVYWTLDPVSTMSVGTRESR
jgi:hypothetical protein